MTHSPQSKMDLFLTFSALTLQGFGGVMPVAQRVLVDKKEWMTREQFVEEFAVAQILPGPNVMNLALAFGRRHFGLGGAVAALAGLLAAPLILILIVASQYAHVIDLPFVQGAFRGVSAVAAGLIVGTSLNLFSALRLNPMGWTASILLVIVGFVALALMRWPLYWVLLGVGGAGILYSYFRHFRVRSERHASEDPSE